jgi:ADP-ribose pyrophosphatase YjhB (NUDIX family)
VSSIHIAAKAIILRDDAILLQECLFDGERVYLLPGGGQQPGESLEAAVRREVLEETGLEVEVDGFLWLRDFIARTHWPTFATEEHRIEAIFRCTAASDAVAASGLAPDTAQVGLHWVPLADLAEISLYPETVKHLLMAYGPAVADPHRLAAPGTRYLGDCP